MERFTLVFNAIIPLVLYIVIGIVGAQAFHLNREKIDVLYKLCFYVFLPCLLIKGFYDVEGGIPQVGTVVIVSVLSLICLPVISSIAAKLMIKEPKTQAGFAVASWKHNSGIVGLPIATALLKSDALSVFLIFLAISAFISSFMTILQITYHLNSGKRPDPKKVFIDVIKNPMLIACIVGILMRFVFHIELGYIPHKVIWTLNDAATPVGLFIIGCTIAFNHGVKNIRYVAVGCFLKLIFAPIFTTTLGYLIGLRGPALAAIMLSQTVSTAINSSSMVYGMGGDVDMTNEIIAGTTICCMFTIFMWAFVILGIQG